VAFIDDLGRASQIAHRAVSDPGALDEMVALAADDIELFVIALGGVRAGLIAAGRSSEVAEISAALSFSTQAAHDRTFPVGHPVHDDDVVSTREYLAGTLFGEKAV
jgi:hypothetical protein